VGRARRDGRLPEWRPALQSLRRGVVAGAESLALRHRGAERSGAPAAIISLLGNCLGRGMP
jgi:hypothetical protein